MRPPRRPPRARLGAAAALVLLPAAAVVLRCNVSSEIPFVWRHADPPWLMAPHPVSAALEQWGSDEVAVTRFTRSVRLEGAAPAALLRLRALRGFELFVNGVSAARSREDAGWRRETRVPLAGWLRPGENELRVDVRNARGPALLSAALVGVDEGAGPGAEGVGRWGVSRAGAALGAALPADDTRVNPLAYAVDGPLESLARRRDALLLLFACGALGCVAAERAQRRRAAALAGLALAAATLGWLLLFANTFVKIPLDVGFDARHHLAYVELLRSRGAVPLATDGWSTFHPPLFHALALAGGALGGWLAQGPAPVAAWKLVPFLSGLASVWVVGALARRLFPGDARLCALAVLFAALLPMHVYSSAYFSNESLHTLLATLALLASVDLLLAERVGLRHALALGTALGLAALTKFTVLVVGGVALGFAAFGLLQVQRAGPARAAGWLAACAGAAAAISGWFYLRNALVFGDPLMANWGDMPGPGHRWWQQPGFHTLAYFTGFGESLRHPYLSGFHSFWDSVYSTFWGDGFVAGRVSPADRHPHWSYDFMSIGYLAALPATGLVLLGALRATALALTDPDPRRRLAFGCLVTASWASLLAFAYLALRLAFYSQAKATYLLVVIGPLAVFFALGTAGCDAWLAARGRAARALFWGWLAVFAGVLFLAFLG